MNGSTSSEGARAVAVRAGELRSESALASGAPGRPWLGLALGVGGVLVVSAVLAVFDMTTLLVPGLLLLIPVLVAALVGRFAAGLLTTVLAAVALTFVSIPPRFSFIPDQRRGVEALVAFVIAAIAVTSGADRIERARAAAVAAREQLDLVLAGGSIGTWSWDVATDTVKWSPTMESLFGLAPGTFDGTYESYVSMLHPDDREAVLASVRSTRSGSQSGHHVLHRIVRADGEVRWLEGRGRPIRNSRGVVVGMTGIAVDVTSLQRERRERERSEFLVRLDEALTSSLQRDDIALAVTKAAVPGLADWCVLHTLADPDAEPREPQVVVAHVDPAMVAFAEDLQRRYPFDPGAETGAAAVMRTGRGELFPSITVEQIESATDDDELVETLRKLEIRSVLVVPLRSRARVFGALQLVTSTSGRLLDTEDLAFAQDVGDRVGTALENALLYERQRDIATTLQEALLPRGLPVIPGIDVAVRYWASGEGSEVGGDFYDVFELGDDGWGVVVGDVCGKGPGAASLIGLARHTMRIAARHEHEPAVVMSWLNEAVNEHEDEVYCTALFGQIGRPAEGGTRELLFAAAGHPLPLLRHADGSVDEIGVPGTPAGLFEDIDVESEKAELRTGDILLLYTDGVTDTPPPYDIDSAEVAGWLAESPADSAAAVADHLGALLSRRLPMSERSDDVAMVVLRLEPT